MAPVVVVIVVVAFLRAHQPPIAALRWTSELLGAAPGSFGSLTETESEAVSAAQHELAELKKQHQQRMAQAEAELARTRRGDRREQRDVDQALDQDQAELSAAIFKSAALNQQLSTAISTDMRHTLLRSLSPKLRRARAEMRSVDTVSQRDYDLEEQALRHLQPALKDDKHALRARLRHTLMAGVTGLSTEGSMLASEQAQQHTQRRHAAFLRTLADELRRARAGLGAAERAHLAQAQQAERQWRARDKAALLQISRVLRGEGKALAAEENAPAPAPLAEVGGNVAREERATAATRAHVLAELTQGLAGEKRLWRMLLGGLGSAVDSERRASLASEQSQMRKAASLLAGRQVAAAGRALLRQWQAAIDEGTSAVAHALLLSNMTAHYARARAASGGRALAATVGATRERTAALARRVRVRGSLAGLIAHHKALERATERLKVKDTARTAGEAAVAETTKDQLERAMAVDQEALEQDMNEQHKKINRLVVSEKRSNDALAVTVYTALKGVQHRIQRTKGRFQEEAGKAREKKLQLHEQADAVAELVGREERRA